MYKVLDLVKIIKENRTKHEADYKEAKASFRVRLVEDLEKKLADAKSGKGVVLQINLIKPQQYLAEYDRTLKMLELTSQEQVELSSEAFAQLVMDEWDWKQSFSTANNFYKVNADLSSDG